MLYMKYPKVQVSIETLKNILKMLAFSLDISNEIDFYEKFKLITCWRNALYLSLFNNMHLYLLLFDNMHLYLYCLIICSIYFIV